MTGIVTAMYDRVDDAFLVYILAILRKYCMSERLATVLLHVVVELRQKIEIEMSPERTTSRLTPSLALSCKPTPLPHLTPNPNPSKKAAGNRHYYYYSSISLGQQLRLLCYCMRHLKLLYASMRSSTQLSIYFACL